MSNIITEITKDQLRTDLPTFRPGDTVKVHVKIVEGTRERIQCIRRCSYQTSWWRN